MTKTTVSTRRGVFALLALAGCTMLLTGIPARAAAAVASADAVRPTARASIHVPPPIRVRLPRFPRIEVPHTALPEIRLPRSLPVRPNAVRTRFGLLPRETATRLQSDVADLHRLENDTGAALFPFLSSDSKTQRRLKAEIRLRLRVCASAGLISVGKNAFGQYVSGDESLFDLSSGFVTSCLTKMLPGIPGQLAAALAQRGLRDAWPAVQQAWDHSPRAEVFRNWLAGLSY